MTHRFPTDTPDTDPQTDIHAGAPTPSSDGPSSPEKRSFLRYALLAVGGLITAALAWGAARFGLFSPSRRLIREVSEETVDGLELKSPVHAADAKAWLSKGFDDAGLTAFDDRCTHLGCRYTWNKTTDRYVCPCHGSEFDPLGAVLRGPATKPLERLYPVKKTDEPVYRLLDKPPAKARSAAGAQPISALTSRRTRQSG